MEETEQTAEVCEEKAVIEQPKKYTNTTTLPDNSKPHFAMRFAGALIDLCTLVLTIFGLFYLFSLSPIGNGLKKYNHEMILIQDQYKITELVEGSGETYGHKVYENDESYNAYTSYTVHDPDESGYHFVVVNNESISQEVKDAYNKAVKADETYANYSFNYRLIEYGITMLAATVSSSIFLLTIPLVNKRRATLGMLFGGSMLIHHKYFVPAKWYQILGRFFFQLLIELALPYLFLSGYTILVIPLLLLIISIIDRKNGRTLHDFVSVTKIIDKRTFIPLSEQQFILYISV